MSIRVLLNGADGRMGLASLTAIDKDPELTLVGKTSKNDDLSAAIKSSNAQVVVDFTNASVVSKNLKIIIESGAHPVIGTTGLLMDEIKKFQEECARLKLGGIIAPNFSFGAVLMMKHAREIAKYFANVEIIEMHHDGKLDSPSGTALRTAEMLAENFKPENKNKETKEIIPGSRGATHHKIPIHAIRMPGFIAQQQIIFGATGETLTLSHNSIDREAYMPGLCFTCKKVLSLDTLVYGMENIL
jgi:4-hydroxy-tetrahydrodipicolinate reductase